MKIYLEPISDLSHRTWYQLKQGLENSYKINTVDDPIEADFIFLHWLRSNNSANYPLSKIVFFDFDDSTDLKCSPDLKICRYYKRSVMSHIKENGERTPIQYPDFVYPIPHATIMNEFKHEFIPHSEREYDITTTFRDGHPTNNLRLELQHFLNNTFKDTSYKTHFGVTPNNSYSSHYDPQYHDLLRNSKIIVTMNPLLWEGDNRLYEAMASGALVFCDKIFSEISNKFEHEKHLIYYNASDYNHLPSLIKYYLQEDKQREKIAKQGYDFAMKYHTPEARIETIINEITK